MIFYIIIDSGFIFLTFIFSEFVLGTKVEDMQVGCLWQGEYILSVSLAGFINYLDVNNPSKPSRVIKVSILMLNRHLAKNYFNINYSHMIKLFLQVKISYK